MASSICMPIVRYLVRTLSLILTREAAGSAGGESGTPL